MGGGEFLLARLQKADTYFSSNPGHGPLGPKFGLAVDNILQFRIVLASGAYEVVNKCSVSSETSSRIKIQNLFLVFLLQILTILVV